MVKINRKEYEVLKGLDDRWKWIAREGEYGGLIFCFREKPHKDIRSGEWGPDATQYKYLGGYELLFQFIQWEDEEPYSIVELIEEFEEYDVYDYVGWEYRKSEETEMKKDIEWLKREIHKELEDWHGVEGGIDGDGINEIMLLINKHEESEVKRLDKKIKELDSYNDELVRDNNQFRNELDSQEVLSEEWIDENKKYNNVHDIGYYIPVDKLYGKIVPKQELPVIPNFVADWIEEKAKELPYVHNPKFRANIIADYFKYAGQGRADELAPKELIKWLDNGKVKEFMIATITGNYEVEEEQKYYVVGKDNTAILSKGIDGNPYPREGVFSDYFVGHEDYMLTEQEIKDYDERYMAFAKPVVVCN